MKSKINPFLQLDKIETMAKNDAIPTKNIIDNLGCFLRDTKYNRTPYRMQFAGVLRARKGKFDNPEIASKEFDHADKLKYPPVQHTPASRCNEEKKPIFYCSYDSGVPIFETRPNIDEYVVLASFKPVIKKKLNLSLPIIGVTQMRESLLKRNPSDLMIKMLERDMHYTSNNHTLLAIDNRIAEWFVTPVDEDKTNKYIYRLTTAFYKALVLYARYNGFRGVNSLMYPSVEARISEFNLVMETQVFDKELTLDTATVYQVEGKVNDTISLRPKKDINWIDNDGIIHWKEAVKSDCIWNLSPTDPSITYYKS